MVKCPDGHILFCVSTKRLVNKKERTIVTTEIAYTVDTFLQLSELGKLIIRADGVISHFSEIEELNHWKNTLYHYDYTQE